MKFLNKNLLSTVFAVLVSSSVVMVPSPAVDPSQTSYGKTVEVSDYNANAPVQNIGRTDQYYTDMGYPKNSEVAAQKLSPAVEAPIDPSVKINFFNHKKMLEDLHNIKNLRQFWAFELVLDGVQSVRNAPLIKGLKKRTWNGKREGDMLSGILDALERTKYQQVMNEFFNFESPKDHKLLNEYMNNLARYALDPRAFSKAKASQIADMIQSLKKQVNDTMVSFKKMVVEIPTSVVHPAIRNLQQVLTELNKMTPANITEALASVSKTK